MLFLLKVSSWEVEVKMVCDCYSRKGIRRYDGLQYFDGTVESRARDKCGADYGGITSPPPGGGGASNILYPDVWSQVSITNPFWCKLTLWKLTHIGDKPPLQYISQCSQKATYISTCANWSYSYVIAWPLWNVCFSMWCVLFNYIRQNAGSISQLMDTKPIIVLISVPIPVKTYPYRCTPSHSLEAQKGPIPLHFVTTHPGRVGAKLPPPPGHYVYYLLPCLR